MTLGFLRGAQRHAQTNSDAPLGAAERLQVLLCRKDASLDHSTARLTLGPAIYDFLTGRIREDPSEGLRNYVRANKDVLEAVTTRLDVSRKQATEAYALAEAHEANPRSVWGYVQGLTRLSQRTPWQDGRFSLDQVASRLIAMVN